MSKIKNKIASKRMKKNAEARAEAFRDLKAEMQQLMEAEDYVTAMDVMAEIAANQQIDPEVMYWGAMCYFHTGDYERAAKWIDNVLTYENSSRAKILLAAICIGDGRTEDGLRLAEAVLAESEAAGADIDEDFMGEVLEPLQYETEHILDNYPHVRAYLAEMYEAREPVEEEDEVQEAAPAAAAASKAELPSEAGQNAVKALARLRQLLEKSRVAGGENQADAVEKQVADRAVQEENCREEPVAKAEPVKAIQVESPESLRKEQAASVQAEVPAAFDVDGTVASIMGKGVSLREKIRLLNVFAGACYQNGDYQSAFDLLAAALQLDCADGATLKNIAYTCLTAGEQEQALEYAAKLPVVDFGLLYALNKN